MKVAVLFDSKYGNTKQLAEFLAEQLGSSDHEVKTFRTKETEPIDLLAFEPEAILFGAPTHVGSPARTLGKFIRKIGKLIEEGTSANVKKAATFNCNNGDDVCHKIAKKVSEAIPKIELYNNSLPVQTGGMKGPLPANWKDLAITFIKGLESFLS